MKYLLACFLWILFCPIMSYANEEEQMYQFSEKEWGELEGKVLADDKEIEDLKAQGQFLLGIVDNAVDAVVQEGIAHEDVCDTLSLMILYLNTAAVNGAQLDDTVADLYQKYAFLIWTRYHKLCET